MSEIGVKSFADILKLKKQFGCKNLKSLYALNVVNIGQLAFSDDPDIVELYSVLDDDGFIKPDNVMSIEIDQLNKHLDSLPDNGKMLLDLYNNIYLSTNRAIFNKVSYTEHVFNRKPEVLRKILSGNATRTKFIFMLIEKNKYLDLRFLSKLDLRKLTIEPRSFKIEHSINPISAKIYEKPIYNWITKILSSPTSKISYKEPKINERLFKDKHRLEYFMINSDKSIVDEIENQFPGKLEDTIRFFRADISDRVATHDLLRMFILNDRMVGLSARIYYYQKRDDTNVVDRIIPDYIVGLIRCTHGYTYHMNKDQVRNYCGDAVINDLSIYRDYISYKKCKYSPIVRTMFPSVVSLYEMGFPIEELARHYIEGSISYGCSDENFVRLVLPLLDIRNIKFHSMTCQIPDCCYGIAIQRNMKSAAQRFGK